MSTFERVTECSTFEQDAREVLGGLRNAFADLIASSPRGIRRAVDVQRVLQVDAKTSWRILKIASASDPLQAGMHVPGRVSIERVKKTAAQLQIEESKIHAIEEAYQRYEYLLKRYAGDRTTYESMISGFGEEDSAQVDLTYRRAAFRANSHILGLQSRAQSVTQILRRNEDDPDRFDFVALHGSYDLKRLRQDVSWKVSGIGGRHEGGEKVSSDPQTLYPGADPTGFIPEFSTTSKPEMRIKAFGAGELVVELVGNAVGIPSEANYIFGHVIRGVAPWYATEKDSHLHARSGPRIPTEMLVHDLLIDVDTFGEIDAHSYVLNDLARRVGVSDLKQNQAHLLPIRDRCELLGGDITSLHTPAIPSQVNLVSWTLDRLGWQGTRFRIYRFQMDYPVVPSSIIMELELPPSP